MVRPHPDPLPQEREQRIAMLGTVAERWHLSRAGTTSPSPWGEGRGEGGRCRSTELFRFRMGLVFIVESRSLCRCAAAAGGGCGRLHGSWFLMPPIKGDQRVSFKPDRQEDFNGRPRHRRWGRSAHLRRGEPEHENQKPHGRQRRQHPAIRPDHLPAPGEQRRHRLRQRSGLIRLLDG